MGNRIPMETTLQHNILETEGGLKEGLNKVQPNQLMGPIKYEATNCRGNIQAITSYADAVKFQRKG